MGKFGACSKNPKVADIPIHVRKIRRKIAIATVHAGAWSMEGEILCRGRLRGLIHSKEARVKIVAKDKSFQNASGIWF